MNQKERKQIKHSLKTAIDRADTWMKLALIGDMLDAKQSESSSPTCKAVVEELTKVRKEICDKTNLYLAEIDDAISKME